MLSTRHLGLKRIHLGGKINQVRVRECDNGLLVCSLPSDTHTPELVVHSGTYDDPIGKAGLAHIVEHLTYCEKDRYRFQGHEEHIQSYAEPRMSVNTTHYATTYGFDLPRRRMADNCAAIIFDKFKQMTDQDMQIPEDTLNIEKNRQLVEHFEMLEGKKEDGLTDFISTQIEKLIFSESNLAHSETVQDIMNLRSQDISDFVRQHYIPNNMHFAFIGPDHGSVLRLAKKHLGHLKSQPTSQIRKELVPRTDMYSELVSPTTRLFWVAVAWPTGPFTIQGPERHHFNAESVGIEVLAENLEKIVQSDLSKRSSVWSKGTYTPQVFINRSYAGGFVFVTFPTASSDFAKIGIESIKKSAEQMIMGGLTEKDRDSMTATQARRAIIEYNKSLRLSSFEKRVDYYAAMEGKGSGLTELITEHLANGDRDLYGIRQYRNILNEYGVRKLRRLAGKYFDPKRSVVLMIKPERPYEF